MTWTPGQTVTRREVLHGELWMDHPVTVVAEDGWWSPFDDWAPASR